MGLLSALKRGPAVAPVPERRVEHRFAADEPVTFEMMSGARDARIVNVSEFGARIEMAHPPALGLSGMLCWNDWDVFCRVVWSDEDGCGVEFDRPLSKDMMVSTAKGVIEASGPVGPVADPSRIPMGRKRARIGRAVRDSWPHAA